MYPVLLDERIYRYIPGRPYSSVSALAERYRQLEAGSSDPSEQWLNWCLFRLSDGTPIGSLQSTVSVNERVAWVAYVLSPGAWGQGYAKESMLWLLSCLAAAKTVDVARAQIDCRNTSSQAVVEGLQFERRADVVEDGAIDFVYEKQLHLVGVRSGELLQSATAPARSVCRVVEKGIT
jgi:RimJ/RimL family protein N-acetyltransferase